MFIAAWIVSGIAGVVFFAAGLMKTLKSKEALAAGGMGWTEDFSVPQIKLIAIAEVLGGLGLILPVATGILPWLTPVAAFALVIIMVGATVVHVRRKEPYMPALVLTVLALAAGVLWLFV
ncbi:DoxX family protein [Agromyces archimandritae]|uniref:DoxX family protein n=1 Tax=Agromyces archimandritae TaxID=2781962 RepID=A0A975FKG6_9MICO|nr:DoxX family protein [Agromyces archimandritae]QTX04188.1 DoxX family protein [Agromyces archimandritae]